MEFKCPDCGKRLRVADHLENPLVRCRSCGAMFRPFEQAAGAAGEVGGQREFTDQESIEPRESAEFNDGQLDEFLTRAQAEAEVSPPVTRRRRTSGSGGWGIGLFVLVLLLSKAPRLMRAFFQNRPQPPQQIQFDEEDFNNEQDERLKQAMEEAQRTLERIRESQQNAEEFLLPPGEAPDAGQAPDAVEPPVPDPDDR